MKINNNIQKIYVCGPTVYNDVHIGNMRPILTFDFILKAYRENNIPFIFIHNLTDIDDKIINRAKELNVSEKEISEKYSKEYLNLLHSFGVNTITHIEKVTENIDLINNYIERLYNLNNAYKDNDGNVWFNVEKNKNAYGSVSNQILENMQFEDNEMSKKYPADFALWKNTTQGVKFHSTFGLGRPGWHTECCALIEKHFKEDGVDFHGGGMDLTFPHHENENIQHFALFNQPLAKTWLRTGTLMIQNEKMSKSLGNFITAKEFINKYGAEILKLVYYNAKTSASINITDELIENMQKILSKYKKALFKIVLEFGMQIITDASKPTEESKNITKHIINGDFALFNSSFNQLIKEFNKNNDYETALTVTRLILVFHELLTDKDTLEHNLKLFNEWRLFIDKKDYKKADEIREKLIQNGYY